MLTRTFYNTFNTIVLLLSVACISSCVDELEDPSGNTGNGDLQGIGEMVQFAAGAADNEVSTRAAGGKVYYMPNDYRFVCRMYYKANKSSEEFDVTHGTDQTAWLQVVGDQGNSLYRQKTFANPSNADSYGNDNQASTFYWQNRREHAFLAWTDLNKARTMKGGSQRGNLKFEQDLIYEYHTGDKSNEWVTQHYEISGINDSEGNAVEFSSLETIYQYAYANAGSIPSVVPAGVDPTKAYFNSVKSWERGNFLKVSNTFADRNEITGYYGWFVCRLFTQKQSYAYDPENPDGVTSGTYYALPYLMNGDIPVAKIENTGTDESPSYQYWACDPEGYVLYDETQYITFYYQIFEKLLEIETIERYPALAFDLRRSAAPLNIGEQPDICQALTVKAPTSASDNRVNLYFEHQFSQVQVNLKSSADNSVQIQANQILSVELLGVTDEGYVFLDLENDVEAPNKAKVRPAGYKPVDILAFTDEELDANPYGTSFGMFPMATADVPTGYLVSYNAITFGQLQAIRIVWSEDATNPTSESAIKHESTFVIRDTQLSNLQSGIRYIWNMELRRGTLAVIRTEIADWIVPPTELEYQGIDGVINE